MKSTLPNAILLTVGAALAAAAALAVAPASSGLAGAATLHDRSFEAGPPPASAWTEYSTPVCERIGDFSGEWYLSSYDGYSDYWAGGVCSNGSETVPVSSSVAQTFVLPSDSTTLVFRYAANRLALDENPPEGDGDLVYVAVNNIWLWSLDMIRANNTFTNEGILVWSEPVAIDLSLFAGQEITLSLGSVSVGQATGNVRFDSLDLRPESSPAQERSWGRIKALYARP